MKKVALAIMLLFPTICFANSQQIPMDRTITSISAYNHTVFVRFTPGFINSQGCPNGGNVTVTIDTTNDKGKEMYSAVLTAAASGKLVGFGINGCNTERPKAYRVDVVF